MTIAVKVFCDGCGYSRPFDGNPRSNTFPGWTRGRGVGDSIKRPRLDWCPLCSKTRAKAKALR